MTTRRTFLAALAAVPVLGKFVLPREAEAATTAVLPEPAASWVEQRSAHRFTTLPQCGLVALSLRGDKPVRAPWGVMYAVQTTVGVISPSANHCGAVGIEVNGKLMYSYTVPPVTASMYANELGDSFPLLLNGGDSVKLRKIGEWPSGAEPFAVIRGFSEPRAKRGGK